DPASHQVYVLDFGDFHGEGNAGVIDVFGADLVIPDVAISEPVSGLTPTSVTLRGTVNPREEGAASCEFEYGTSTSYGQHAPCTAPVGNGDAPVEVQSGTITGLEPDTTYHYRLDASNEHGTNTGECPADCSTFTTPGPGIHAQSASDVAASSATLNATINPHGAPTSFYFQYSTEDTAGCETTPPSSSCPAIPAPPGGAIGSAEGGWGVARRPPPGPSAPTRLP